MKKERGIILYVAGTTTALSICTLIFNKIVKTFLETTGDGVKFNSPNSGKMQSGGKKEDGGLFYVYRIIDDRSKKNEVEHAKLVYGAVAIEIANSMLNTRTTHLDLNTLVCNYYNDMSNYGESQEYKEILGESDYKILLMPK